MMRRSKAYSNLVVGSILALLALTFGAISADGETFVVNSSSDTHDASPGDGIAGDHINPDSSTISLRAAIEEASALPGADTIHVPVTVSPVRLDLGTLEVSGDSTIILGLGGWPSIDGLHNWRNEPSLTVSASHCRISGVTFTRSRGSAIIITSSANRIGGQSVNERVVLVGNNLDGVDFAAVEIRGNDAIFNVVQGCWIGVYENGAISQGNGTGIHLTQGARRNEIGGPGEANRNLISGNYGWGVVIDGNSDSNVVAGNFIGPDVTGDVGPGNGPGGVLVRGAATGNTIGGVDFSWGNLISANHGDGVCFDGISVTGNFVTGNFIGTEITGQLRLANEGNGVALVNGAHANTIGGDGAEDGNVISGNFRSGALLSGVGTDDNVLLGNFVGIEVVGFAAIGNAVESGAGVLIRDGARNNRVGGSTVGERNIISGNSGYGVHVTGPGTNGNVVSACFIGTNGFGLSSAFNTVGVVIDSGAQYNRVGGSTTGQGNLISGNRAQHFPFGAGVLIRGHPTDFNEVKGNAIGVDINGARALPNGSAGVIIADGAQHNVVGDTILAGGNVISGNGSAELSEGLAAGVHIFGTGTRFNEVVGNWIGRSTNGLAIVANVGHGIGVFAGACDNAIGGSTSASGNVITASDYHGIIVSGAESRRNLVRYNSTYGNDSLGMAVTSGAQDGIQPPRLVVGYVSEVFGDAAPPGAIVDVYRAATDQFDSGEGRQLVGSGMADNVGDFHVYLSGVGAFDTLTAIVTDSNNNSSAYAENIPATPQSDVEESTDILPISFRLEQNYPNPFNPVTRIAYSLARRSFVQLEVFNVIGQRVKTLVALEQAAGEYQVDWDGTDSKGDRVSSGVYIYRLMSDTDISQKKMILLK